MQRVTFRSPLQDAPEDQYARHVARRESGYEATSHVQAIRLHRLARTHSGYPTPSTVAANHGMTVAAGTTVGRMRPRLCAGFRGRAARRGF
jgi:hypothetical protein